MGRNAANAGGTKRPRRPHQPAGRLGGIPISKWAGGTMRKCWEAISIECVMSPEEHTTENGMVERPHRILIVDDERSIRSLFRRQLEMEGHEIICAASG